MEEAGFCHLQEEKFSPLYGNEFKDRTDVIRAVHALVEPLLPCFNASGARVQLEAGGAHFDRAAADLEGFARPLWGLASLAAGGEHFAYWDIFCRGLASGTNPDHPDYWGDISQSDQRQVELAAIGFSLALVPEKIWEPLDKEARNNVATYLISGRQQPYHDCNWWFFRVLVDLGLSTVGVAVDENMTNAALDTLESYYLENGWYKDGQLGRIDYYNPFAFHFYGLIFAVLCPKLSKSAQRAQRFRDRACLFAKTQFINFFSDDGACIPFGRSLTYRFACGSLWGALAFADEECLPWGVLKGLYLRHMRWWSKRPICRSGNGRLSIGFAYSHPHMCETYNSAGSPYWAMKAFLPLALPFSHPFWSAKETGMIERKSPIVLQTPGMVISHHHSDTVALISGPEHLPVRYAAEKYAKFAYSSRYGFSVESDDRQFTDAVFDSMIGLSDDRRHFRIRETSEIVRVANNILYSKWHPWIDVTVETWLVPQDLWHVRVHRITSPRRLYTLEGGFAVPRADFDSDAITVAERSAWIAAYADCSGIQDLSPTLRRTARVHKAPPNTSIMFPRTLIPQVSGTVEPGSATIYACAVLAGVSRKEIKQAWKTCPAAPDVADLERMILSSGIPVGCHE